MLSVKREIGDEKDIKVSIGYLNLQVNIVHVGLYDLDIPLGLQQMDHYGNYMRVQCVKRIHQDVPFRILQRRPIDACVHEYPNILYGLLHHMTFTL